MAQTVEEKLNAARSGRAPTIAAAARGRMSRDPGPYLDRISVSKHVPDSDGSWKKLLIQPVSIPALSHTGVRTAFTGVESAPLLRPDGCSTNSLKALIQTSVRSTGSTAARNPKLRLRDKRFSQRASALSEPQHARSGGGSPGGVDGMSAMPSVFGRQGAPQESSVSMLIGAEGAASPAAAGTSGAGTATATDAFTNLNMRTRARIAVGEEATANRADRIFEAAEADRAVASGSKPRRRRKKKKKKSAYGSAPGRPAAPAVGGARSTGNTRELFEGMLDDIYGVTAESKLRKGRHK